MTSHQEMGVGFDVKVINGGNDDETPQLSSTASSDLATIFGHTEDK